MARSGKDVVYRSDSGRCFGDAGHDAHRAAQDAPSAVHVGFALYYGCAMRRNNRVDDIHIIHIYIDKHNILWYPLTEK